MLIEFNDNISPFNMVVVDDLAPIWHQYARETIMIMLAGHLVRVAQCNLEVIGK